MDKRNQFQKLEDVAELLGWSYTDNAEYITLQMYTEQGQDFSFDIDSTEDLLEEIHNYWIDFVPSREAMKWLDEDGHGKNGAPYDMQDVLDDMRGIDKKLEELYNTFRCLNYA